MNYLQHFGILGMKWGRRKSRSGGSDTSSEDHKSASSLKKKKLSEMSNEELKKLTARLQLEKQYKDLTKVELGGGQKFVSDVLQGVGKQIATKYLANIVDGFGQSIFKSINEQLLKNK